MRFLPTKVHGLLDYLVGIALAISPFLLWTTEMDIDLWIPLVAGVALIVISVCTDYEWGAAKTFTMRSHLTLDLLLGVFLAISPWLFGFADVVFVPFLVFGAFEIIAALVTKLEPERRGKLGPSTL
jgi:putative flippase GtrA